MLSHASVQRRANLLQVRLTFALAEGDVSMERTP